MAQVCVVGKDIPASPAIDALAIKVGILLSNDKVFGGNLLAEAQKPENWNHQGKNYTVLSLFLTSFKEYLSGSCQISYSGLKSIARKWNESPEIQHDPMSVAMRDNLLQILGTVTEPDLQERATLLRSALNMGTSNIALTKAPEASKPPVVMLPDAAKAPLPPIARPEGKSMGVTEWMSDEKIFGKKIAEWTPEARFGRFYTLNKAIETLRSYLDGKASNAELRARLKAWEKNDCFKDSLSRIALVVLSMKLAVYAPSSPDPIITERVKKAVELLPQIHEEKKAEVSDATVKVEDKSPPTPAGNADASKVLEALNDEAIFGDKLSVYSEPSAKYGKYYKLQKVIEEVRSYISGDKGVTYASLKQKMEAWTKSPDYNDVVSQRARGQLITLLAAQNPEAALKVKIETVLLLLRNTPAVEVTAAPAPGVKTVEVVKVAAEPSDPIESSYSFDMSAFPAGGLTSVTRENLASELTRLARIAGQNYAKQLGSDFIVNNTPSFEFDSNGRLSKISFNQVSAEKGITQGSQMTAALKMLAQEWSSIKFLPNIKFNGNASTFTGH